LLGLERFFAFGSFAIGIIRVFPASGCSLAFLRL